MRKIAVAAILGLVLLLIVSSAIPARASPGSGLTGGSLRVAVRGSLSLDPFTATDADSWKVIPLVYDSLARIDPVTLKPTAWAAQSWTTSGTNLIATLRSDLTFHDLSAVTATDVVYSYNQYKAVGRVASDLVVTSSGNTVTLGSATSAGLLYGQGLTLPIVKSGTVASPVGSGPWMLTSSTASSWTLSANRNHFWPPNLDTVTFSVYSSTTSAATDLLSGKLDFIGWSLLVDEPAQIINVGGTNKTLLADSNIVQNPGLMQLSVGFNLASGKPTADASLRMALAKTLNPILYRQIYPSTVISRSPIIQEDVPWYNPNVAVYQVKINALSGSPPRSSALLTPSLQILDQAGYLDRDGDGIRESPTGTPLSLTVVGIPVEENARTFTIQEATTDVFNRMGIKASIVSVPGANILARIASGNYDVFVASLGSDLDPGFMWDYLHSTGGLNYFHIADSSLDASLVTANSAVDPAARATAVMAAQLRAMSLGFFIPVLHFNAVESTVRGSFDGWVSMPGGVNNFWTYQMLHVASAGSLVATLTLVPTSVKSSGAVSAIAKVSDAAGVPVADAAVSFWIEGTQVASGTTDAAGTLGKSLTAPTTQGAKDVQVTIQASKIGYSGTTAWAWMTVTSNIRPLAVSVASSAVTVASGTAATITVTVTSAGTAVAGATVSVQVVGLGGHVATGQGTTDAAGKFTTTFSADVGPRTQFRVVATATGPGYTDGTGSTTIVTEQRVGTVEPRVTPGLDSTTIIAAVLALVVIGALAAFWGRKK